MHRDVRLKSRHNIELAARLWLAENEPQAIVIIIHGLGDYSGRFAPVAKFLTKSGITVLSYDQRGHGLTGGRMPSFQSLVDDIDVAILYARNDVGQTNIASRPLPIFLYGQSLGGGEVLYHALTAASPANGIIASSPLLRPTHQPPGWKLLIGRTLGRLWPTLTLGTGINAAHLTHDPTEIDRYLRDVYIHHRVSAALGTTMLEACEWCLENAAGLAVPTLLLHGSDDEITSCEASKQFAKRAGAIVQLRIWQGLYHDLHFELEKEAVLQSIVEWVHERVSSI